LPLEVKSGANTKAKSLGVYMEKYKPQTAVRCSLSNYNRSENLIDIPIYAIGQLEEILTD